MLSQCVQYHNASKFTAGFQHFPFIVLYRCGDTHWSWQIILFIIEHYPTHSIIRFISCPACLRWGLWTDMRADIDERILPYTWRDNIHEEHSIGEGDGICVCCAWGKTPDLWYGLTSSHRNIGTDRKGGHLILWSVTDHLFICLLRDLCFIQITKFRCSIHFHGHRCTECCT